MPTQFIMPYVDPPENAVPGVPSYYATACIVNGVAEGVIVESHLGRPTKVEGNPNHPASLGATSVHGQACVFDLYDPDRAKEITEQGEFREWDAFLVRFRRAARGAPGARGGDGLFILTDTVTSPTLASQLAAVMAAFPKASVHHYDPAGSESARAGAQLAFGRPAHSYYRLDQAEVILSLDSDFLACGPGSTRYAHDYAFRRRVRGSNTAMNRLYVVETAMTSTGGKAEHRLPLRYGEIESFARDLSAAISGGGSAPTATGHAAWIDTAARGFACPPRSLRGRLRRYTATSRPCV